MRLIALLFLAVFFFNNGANAKLKENKLFINYGQRLMADSSYLPFYCINESNSLDSGSTLLSLVRNQDSLDLWLVNNTNRTLTVSCLINQTIASGDSFLFTIYSWTSQNYIPVYSTDSSERYLGVQTAIVMKNSEQQQLYVWCLEERSKTISESIANQNAYSFSNYSPEYFFINQRYYPQTMADSISRVKGFVGDSIFILVINYGHSGHSLHFHGYHAEDLNSLSGLSGKVYKDTLPVKKGASGLLLIIPDKPGEYPVHDHNLVAVSGGGIYPNGMFTTLLIK